MIQVLRNGWKLIILTVWMITLVIFGVTFNGEYALAQQNPCVAGQPCTEIVDNQPSVKSAPSQTNPCVPGKPCLESQFKKNPRGICVPGFPCISLPTTPPPTKDPAHKPAGKPDNPKAEIM